MATPSLLLVRLLRETADRLAAGAPYRWTHMGQCNCGHLAQTVTGLDPRRLHQRTLDGQGGEWSEQANDYCSLTGAPLGRVIDALVEVGLEPRDLGHLEYLSDPRVLAALPDGRRHLRRNVREDVVLYLRTWATQLEGAAKPAPVLEFAEPVGA